MKVKNPVEINAILNNLTPEIIVDIIRNGVNNVQVSTNHAVKLIQIYTTGKVTDQIRESHELIKSIRSDT
jgi:hypothetical protein